MTILSESNHTQINRLTIRTANPDKLAVRLQAGRWLGLANLTPPGLPPGAILVVQRLVASQSGARKAETGGLPPDWEAAARRALDSARIRAAQPARGSAPAASEVLFADRSEMLAALTSDWLSASLSGRWYWEALYRQELRQSGAWDRVVFRAWLEAPEFIPPTLLRLAGRAEAVDFACRLGPRPARQLVSALIAAFDLLRWPPSPAPGRYQAAPASGRRPNPNSLPAPTLSGIPASLQAGRSIAPAPWLPWVPESAAAGLSSAGAALLGLGLLLARAPYQLHQPAPLAPPGWTLANLLSSYLAGQEFEQEAEAGPEQLLAPPTSENGQPEELPPPGLPTLAPPPSPARSLRRPAIHFQPPGADSPGLKLPPPPGQPAGPEPLPTVRPEETALTAPALQALPSPLPAAEPVPVLETWVVETAYGGLFYLLNLALALGLAADFSSPRPGLDLSPWDLLALLGRAFLGRPLLADPLWDCLADLAGRASAQPPGDGFVPPQTWSLPPAWLEAFFSPPPVRPFSCQPGAARRPARRLSLPVSLQAGRLRVWFPWQRSGFWLLDVPLSDARAARLALSGLPRLHLRPQRLPRSLPADPLERWLGWLFAYADCRLRLALGLDPTQDLAAFLLCHPARVEVSPGRVDIHLSLEALPLAIRLAGLDRDLGWLPAAGRYVHFHFA